MLLFLDGIDHYGSGINNTSVPASKWIGAGFLETVGNSRDSIAPPYGRGQYGSLYGGSVLTYTLPAAKQTVIVGFHMIVATGGDNNWFRLLDAGPVVQCSLKIGSDGLITAYRDSSGGTALGNSWADTGKLFPIYGWHWVTIKFKIDNATGTVDVVVDGVNILSLSGVDTQNTANASASQVQFLRTAGGLGIDNILICDDTGATFNNLLGEYRVETQFPDADGAAVAWTPSAGANWQNVDENPPNDDTDYNETSTAAAIDEYNYPSFVVAANIAAVAINARTRKTDAGAVNGKQVTRSGVTNYFSAVIAEPAGYTYSQTIQETDPNTAAAWTSANLNAAQFGYQRQ